MRRYYWMIAAGVELASPTPTVLEALVVGAWQTTSWHPVQARIAQFYGIGPQQVRRISRKAATSYGVVERRRRTCPGKCMVCA